MITRKKNNLKRIIFAAFILLILIAALRYFMRSGGGGGAVSRPALPGGETRVSSQSGEITQNRPETIQPAAAVAHTAETAASAGAAESSEASLDARALNAKPAAAQPAQHSVKQTEPPGTKGVITGNGVNVRRESRIDAANSNVVTKVNKGEQVQIIGAEKPANDNRQWYNIKLKNGKTGFVREDLIKIE